MDRDTLVLGLAAVFAGISMLLVVLGFAYQLFFLLVAVPFVLTTYLMWEHASGRFRERIRQSRTRRGRGRGAENAAGRGPSDFRGFGPGRRSAADGAGAEAGAGAGGPNGPGGASGGAGRRGRRGRNRNRRRRSRGAEEAASSRLSPAEAYRTLDLSSSATTAEVKDAYRSKVKEVHPDTESGSREEFKRVNRAYERLSE
ncbi:J domain-containing protein [Halogeometricum sp. S1BR25-6]|uniref:J domain-containing protein n=1 Tax=Halogeometricum salsisoli TaxID=2950536 RepID=A0ABU2GFI2_9EURY|nr:J domain-containing protein [Halogeometricum sp. S1BR25-6]MDS0299561.1 J domain-containing protein [Halogeometricum sp. S1BR25-6]